MFYSLQQPRRLPVSQAGRQTMNAGNRWTRFSVGGCYGRGTIVASFDTDPGGAFTY
jgi:hypothetical protein